MPRPKKTILHVTSVADGTLYHREEEDGTLTFLCCFSNDEPDLEDAVATLIDAWDDHRLVYANRTKQQTDSAKTLRDFFQQDVST